MNNKTKFKWWLNVKWQKRIFLLTWQVETIGDAYMAVAGAPTVTRFHALSMCNMALDMLEAMHQLKDPSTPQDSMKIRVGKYPNDTRNRWAGEFPSAKRKKSWYSLTCVWFLLLVCAHIRTHGHTQTPFQLFIGNQFPVISFSASLWTSVRCLSFTLSSLLFQSIQLDPSVFWNEAIINSVKHFRLVVELQMRVNNHYFLSPLFSFLSFVFLGCDGFTLFNSSYWR